MSNELSSKIEQVKKDINTRLIINRVPIKIKRKFIDLANSEEFLGDYGFCLKWLMDFREGLLTSPNQILIDQIEHLTKEVEMLKQVKPVEEKENVIRLMNGRIIKRKR